MGTTQIIKSLQNTVKNHKEIRGIELDNLIKEQELEKLKLENLERNTPQSNIKNKKDRVEKITYYINTDINLSPELRQKSYKKNKN